MRGRFSRVVRLHEDHQTTMSNTATQAMVDSGDETEYLFKDERHCQEAFLSWWLSPKGVLSSCTSIPGKPPLQSTTAVAAAAFPKGQCMQFNDIMATELTTVSPGFGPQPLKRQVDALCGDWAVPDREMEDVEPRREVRADLERHPEEMESEAHLEELQVEDRSDSFGESQAGQQEETHIEDLNEFKAMLAEDFQSWWVRESSRCPIKSPAAVPASHDEDNPAIAPAAAAAAAAAPADVVLGRIFLEARLSCIDEAGIDVILEQQVLQLHLYEREVDAARCFLDDHNELSPSFVRRYQQPLSRWLQSKVQAAPPDIAFNKHIVCGDLEEIVRCYGSGV